MRRGFRARKIPRGGLFEVVSALVLVLHAGDDAVPEAVLDRMKAIYDRWNKDHPFLTGADDQPMAALHALGSASPEEIGSRVEAHYRALQLASHILAAAPGDAAAHAGRFAAIASRLKRHEIRVGQAERDEVALLTLDPRDPGVLADHVGEAVRRLRTAPHRPSKGLAFSIACGLVLATGTPASDAVGARAVADLVQQASLIQMQQAAMMAACAASVSASTSS